MINKAVNIFRSIVVIFFATVQFLIAVNVPVAWNLADRRKCIWHPTDLESTSGTFLDWTWCQVSRCRIFNHLSASDPASPIGVVGGCRTAWRRCARMRVRLAKGHVNLPLRVDSVLVHGRSWTMKSRSNQCCRSQFRRPPSFFVSDEVLPKQPPKALNVIVLCRHLFSSWMMLLLHFMCCGALVVGALCHGLICHSTLDNTQRKLKTSW